MYELAPYSGFSPIIITFIIVLITTVAQNYTSQTKKSGHFLSLILINYYDTIMFLIIYIIMFWATRTLIFQIASTAQPFYQFGREERRMQMAPYLT